MGQLTSAWRSLSSRARRRRAGGLEPLEDRRLLAVLADSTWNYDQVAPAWFGAPAARDFDAREILPARPASEWIVRLGEECLSAASAPSNVAPLLGFSAGVSFQVLRGLGLPGEVLVSSTSEDAAIEAALRVNVNVASFSRNGVVRAADAPDDARFPELVGLHNTGQLPETPPTFPDIDAPQAWNEQTGSENVVVAVIDSGIDVTHPDLAENLWTNDEEVVNGHDDDGNGCIDDVNGCSFVNLALEDYEDQDPANDEWLPSGNVTDESGHGTHVAGTIGARGNNAIGVAGVAQTTSLMPLQVLGADNTGSTANVRAAIRYATLMAAGMQAPTSNDPQRLRVINASFGSYTADNGLYADIRAAGDAGILVVAAAGNGVDGVSGVDTDATPFYPASYDLDNIISVAAVDNYDRLARFSNYGWLSVDIAAPGTGVLSTVPGGGYATSNGTSMAAPMVSGAAALLWSEFPEATRSEVRAALLRGGDSVAELQEKVASGKRLNAAGALAVDVAAPFVELLDATTVSSPNDVALIRLRVADNHALNPSDIAKSSLSVRRLGGSETLSAVCVDVVAGAGEHDYVATYRLEPPQGRSTWSEHDFGDYQLAVPDGAIADPAGNVAPTKTLGYFRVAVDEPNVIRVNDSRDLLADQVGRSTTTLRMAILAANQLSRPDQPITIILPDLTPEGPSNVATTYRLTRERDGDDSDDTGDLDVRGNVILVGDGFARSVIDANQLDRAIDVQPGAKLSVRGVTLRGGKTIELLDRDGGGIRNQGALTLDDVVLRDNEGNRGGGLFNAQFSTATVRGSSFVNNVARSLGGGVFNVSEVGREKPQLDTLLAIGGEQPVNTITAAPQDFPAVAIDERGIALVVWQSFDGLDAGRIYAQRYDKAGERLGGQIQVNASTTQRLYPTVAVDADGNALIAWQGAGADGQGWGIHARRMNPLGVFISDEFIPYDARQGHQTSPQVAIGRGGEELIVWNGNGPSDDEGVYARFRTSAANGGTPISCRANVTTAGVQSGALAAIADDGSAVVVWTSDGPDGRSSIVGRRLNSFGIPLGDEFVIAESIERSLRATSVVATRGGYAVAWNEANPDDGTSRVLFRRLDQYGTRLDTARPLSDGATYEERGAALAALPDGGFAVTFSSLGRDASGWGVFVRQFDAAGVPRSAVLPVNTTATGAQLNPRIAANSSGLITIVWNGAGAGDSNGIVLRRFEASFNEDSVVDAATLTLENVTISENWALLDGGGVYSSPDTVTWLNQVTVHKNVVVPAGGGALAGAPDGTLAIKATLVAGNYSGGVLADLRGEITSLGYNLVTSATGAIGFGRRNDLVDVQAATGLAPLPVDGAPLVHQLYAGSRAIDGGDPARAPAFDQIGSPRPADGDGDGVSVADIGAAERYFGEARGVRYYDQNGNGARDEGETALAGLVVYLDTHNFGVRDSDEPFAVTSATGEYAFRNVKPGTYTVAVEPQAGWRTTTPAALVPADQPSLTAPVKAIQQVAVDVDFDGDLDLVALERDPLPEEDRLLLYLNDGGGIFASSPMTIATGVNYAADTLTPGDVDADGLVDFIVAESNDSGKLTWLRNLDDGQFAAPQTIVPAAKSPSAPMLARFNGDFFPDLAWLERNDAGQSVVRVAIHDGVGYAGQQSSFTLDSVVDAIVTGDVDGDGAVDLIVGRDWLHNSGAGVFDAPQAVEGQNVATLHQVADLDQDGDQDLLGLQVAAKKLQLLRKNPQGRFDLETAVDLPGIPSTVTLGDLDRDGDPDVLVMLNDGAVIPVFNDQGKLRLGPPALTLDFGDERPLSVVAGDLDGDDADDVSVLLEPASGATRRIAVFRNSGAAARVNVGPGELVNGLDFGEQAFKAEFSGFFFNDLDRDGYYDADYENPLPNRVVFLDSPQGTLSRTSGPDGRYVFSNLAPLQEYTVRTSAQSGWAQTVPRPEQDSRYRVMLPADGAATNLNFGSYQLVNVGQGGQSNSTIRGVYFRDANGNGIQDPGENGVPGMPIHLVGADTRNTNVDGVYEFTGLGAGVHVVSVDAEAIITAEPRGNAFGVSQLRVGDAPQAIALVDFDSDGDLDVATPNAGSNDVSILRNTNGVFDAVSPLAAGITNAVGPSSIAVGDFDGLYGLDLAVTNLYTKNVSIFLSTPGKWFTLGGSYAAGDDPTAVAAGHFVRDKGVMDLAVVNEREGTVRILRNDGAGRFSISSSMGVGDHPRAIAAADLDNNGGTDLVVANFDSANLSVLWNSGGQFTLGPAVAAGTGPASLAIDDLDGDDVPELIVGNYFASNVTIHRKNADRTFSTIAALSLPLSPTSLAAVDIDNDSDVDVIAATRTLSGEQLGVSLLRNRTNGALDFAPAEAINLGAGDLPLSRHLSVAAGDLDRDGRADLVVGDGVDNKARIVLNRAAVGSHRVLLTGEANPTAPLYNFAVRSIYNPPTIDDIPEQTLNEDASPRQVRLTGVTAGAGEQQQPLRVDVTAGDQGFFAELYASFDQAVGWSVNFRPAPNQNGSAEVVVMVTDGGGDNDLGTPNDNGVTTKSFTVHITPINDPPALSLQRTVITRNEDSPTYAEAAFASVTDVDVAPGGTPGPITYLVDQFDRSLFAVEPSIAPDGTLTFTPAANAFGSTTVRIRARDDDGGNDTSEPQQLLIVIQAVNDPPTFTPGPDVFVLLDGGQNVFRNWATEISAGAPNEAQPLTFWVTANIALYDVGGYPTVASDGTLSFRLKPGVRSTQVQIALSDNESPPPPNGYKNLRITAVIPGDANLDYAVDLDDLNAVRNHFGQVGARIEGDTYPFDGAVDLDDLNAVRNHFGAAAAPAMTAPPDRAAYPGADGARRQASDALFHSLGSRDADDVPIRSKRWERRLLAR